jgi:hypothetical protein
LLKLIDVNARVLPTVVHVISEDVVQIGACDWRGGKREGGRGHNGQRTRRDLHLSHVTSALIRSPILPPEER